MSLGWEGQQGSETRPLEVQGLQNREKSFRFRWEQRSVCPGSGCIRSLAGPVSRSKIALLTKSSQATSSLFPETPTVIHKHHPPDLSTFKALPLNPSQHLLVGTSLGHGGHIWPLHQVQAGFSQPRQSTAC